jgi:hypothetical protein
MCIIKKRLTALGLGLICLIFLSSSFTNRFIDFQRDYNSQNPITLDGSPMKVFQLLPPEGLIEPGWNAEGVMFSYLDNGHKEMPTTFDYWLADNVFKIRVKRSTVGIASGKIFEFGINFEGKAIELIKDGQVGEYKPM